jgi:transposase InsO family protein
VAENLLNREFNPTKANEVWVADITYIPTRDGWLYLAAVEDLYSRMVVGCQDGARGRTHGEPCAKLKGEG